MKNDNTENLKKERIKQNLKRMGLFGVAIVFVIAGCGNDKKSAGDRAKSATDAVTKKSSEVKDAVTGTSEEARAEVEARLTRETADLKARIAELEAKENEETVAEIKAAGKTRLDHLKASVTSANDYLVGLKNSADAEWKAKKEATLTALENAKTKVSAALDRQKLKEEVNAKLEKIDSKIDEFTVQASKAATDAKQKLDETRVKLEAKYEELKKESDKFQRSTEEKWDHFKEGFAKSFEELSNAFKGLLD